jgi:hypothetical protein
MELHDQLAKQRQAGTTEVQPPSGKDAAHPASQPRPPGLRDTPAPVARRYAHLAPDHLQEVVKFNPLTALTVC